MNREEQTQLLLAELERQQVGGDEMTHHIMGNLAELSYTAYENGVIPFKLSPPDDITLVRLILLAIDYGKDGVPGELRM